MTKNIVFLGYITTIKTEQGYRYGYINSNRKKLLKNEYNDIYRILELDDLKSTYLIATKNGQQGVIKDGTVIISCAYQNIEYDDYNNVFVLEKGKNIGVADIQGNKIIDTKYKEINVKGIYIQAIEVDDSIKYFDAKGNELVDHKYESVLRTSNENYLITIDENGKYGLIDKEEKTLLENSYKYLEYLYDDYFIASNEKGYLGIIDSKGNTVVDFEYEVLQEIEDTQVIEAKKLKKKTTDLYSSKLEKIYTKKDATISTYLDYIKASSKNEVTYFDLQGNAIESPTYKEEQAPEIIGEYHKIYYGYGQSYYTKE